jgi:hypothetical protein
MEMIAIVPAMAASCTILGIDVRRKGIQSLHDAGVFRPAIESPFVLKTLPKCKAAFRRRGDLGPS